MLNAACYIRVSTEEQTEYSPSAQKRAIFTYAKNNSINIAPCHIFVDEGISGRSACKRPAFMSMIAAAKKKPAPFSLILVHRFDRFSRSREDSIVYKSLLKKECNVKVVSVTEPMENDKFSIILEAILEAMAEYYSLNLSDEVTKGMQEKAFYGEFQTRPPFGYEIRQKGGDVCIVPKEKEIVKKIFALRLKNETLADIAVFLNQQGHTTRSKNHFTRKNVSYILKNPTYSGFLIWNRRMQNGKGFKPVDQWIISRSKNIPLIIDNNTFFTVNPWFYELCKSRNII